MTGRAGIVIGSIVVAALVATSGTAGAGSGTSATERIRAAARRTAHGTALVRGAEWVDDGGLRYGLFDVYGQEDFDAQRSRAMLHMPLSDIDPKLEDVYVDAMFLKRTAYESIWGLDLPGGQTWVRISPADAKVAGAVQSFSASSAFNDLRVLEAVHGVRLTGTVKIRGVRTTRYAVKLDLRPKHGRAGDGASGPDPGFITGRSASGKRLDASRVPGVVWLDRQGRLRRLRYSFPLHASGGTGQLVMAMEYYDFGAHVAISAPPAAKTVAFPEVIDEVRTFFAHIRGERETPAAGSV